MTLPTHIPPAVLRSPRVTLRVKKRGGVIGSEAIAVAFEVAPGQFATRAPDGQFRIIDPRTVVAVNRDGGAVFDNMVEAGYRDVCERMMQ